MNKTNNKSRIIGLASVVLVWVILTVACFVKPAVEFSISERRKLAQFPEVTAEKILSGKFMRDFESYTLDQFPARDTFRTLKSIAVLYGFGQKDNNGIYIADGSAAKVEYPLNQPSLNNAINKINRQYEQLIKDSGGKVFLSIVPDKGYYLAKENGYPAMDYQKLIADMQAGMPYAEYIDITGTLDIDSYYKTDTHWRQEKIIDTAKELAKALGVYENISWEYTEEKREEPFFGVYYGQSALPLKSERITLLRNDILDNCLVTNSMKEGVVMGIYDLEKMTSHDPYETYLSGAVPIVKIENPNATTDKNLIIYRDSFGSSIAPLLCEAYATVTLVDIRYTDIGTIEKSVDFQNSDVLFMYSTLILNSSSTFK